MRPLATLLLALALPIFTASCSSKDDTPGRRDAGTGGDSGTTPDAGSGMDAGPRDSGPPVPDTGPVPDSGMCPPPTDVPYTDHIVDEEFTDPPSCSGCPGMYTGTSSLDIGMIPAGETTI